MEDESDVKNDCKRKHEETHVDFKEIKVQKNDIIINNKIFASIYEDTELIE